MQTILYKDGKELMRGEPVPVSPGSAENLEGIPILYRMPIVTNMPPGDYVLQLVTADKKNSKKKEGAAAQTLGFTVTDNQTCDTGGNVCR